MTMTVTSKRSGPAYLPRLRRPSRETLLGLSTIAAFLVIWQGVYMLGLMPKWAFPSPIQVVRAFYELGMSGTLLSNRRRASGGR